MKTDISAAAKTHQTGNTSRKRVFLSVRVWQCKCWKCVEDYAWVLVYL